MASASSWDSPPPPRKPGLSVLGKVFIGCGAALLCFFLAIGAGLWLVVGKATKAMDQGWAQIHRDVQNLKTEAGTRTLYRNNPGLAMNFPTEEEFVKAAAEWRGKLGEVPERRPELKELFANKGNGGITFRSHETDGRKSLTVRLRMSTGAMLMVEMENDKLTDIQVD